MSTVKADYLVNAAGTGAPTLTNGAVLPAGSAAAPAISPTGDSNTGIFFPAADTIAFSEGGAEAMRIDSSGNVGIGTTSPQAKLDVAGSIISRASSGEGGEIAFNNIGDASLGLIVDVSSADVGRIFQVRNNSTLQLGQLVGTGGIVSLYTAATERMRIDSSGNLLFNSGYGSVATAFGCRAWVNFNGQGTVAIRASGNVSSITDNGTGDFTVNFTTAMPDENYALSGIVRNTDADTGNTLAIMIVYPGSTILAGSCRVATGRSHSTSKVDFNANLITFVR